MLLLFSSGLLHSLSSFLSSLNGSSGKCFSSLSAFLGDSSGFSLVSLYLMSEESLSGCSFLVSLVAADLAELSILLSLPSIETLLSLSFVECAFLNATLQVLHQHYALT